MLTPYSNIISVTTTSAFDADYLAVLNYATTQGYTLPSSGQQLLQNQLVVDLKDAGIWSKLDTFGVWATDGDSDFALIDWIRLTDYTAVNSPTFTANQGFTGDGTSSTIGINFNASTSGINYQLNNASFGVYRRSGVGIRGVASIGLNQSGMIFDSSGAFQGVNSGNTRTYVGTRFDSIDYGLLALHRYSSTEFRLSKDSTLLATGTQTSTELPTNFQIFRDAYVLSSWECSMFYAGAELRAEITDFSNAINTYISAL
jgi:hypothetical protein